MARRNIIRLKGDKVIWVVILFLALTSIVAVYSSSNALAYKSGDSTFSFLLRQLTYVGIGFITLIVCYKIPLGWYRRISSILFYISIGLLAYLIVGGVTLNQATRWINIGFISFQPSELAKISTVLYIAKTLESSSLDTFKDYVIKILIPLGVLCLLCLYGSVSVTLMIGFVSFIILLCAGIKSKFLLYTLGIIIAMAAIVFTLHSITGIFPRIDTMTARVERYFVDESELSEEEKKIQEDKNFQSIHAKEAIQLGGIIGRGPGNSIKRDILPHPYSDFIYATIIEEWGLFGGIAVIFLYIILLYRCIVIAIACSQVFSAITVMGLSLLITLQAMLHILVNIGAIPVTGQTLPLISQGGTSLIIISSAFGIILSVNRTIELSKEN